MAASTSKNIGLGVFILVGLALLTGFVFFIGANQNLFGSTTQVATVFHNISGLQPGANVRFSGINVGTVEKIQITSDTTVKVSMRLNNSVVPYVKKDSRAAIGSDGIMGDKTLTLTAGSVNGTSIQGGDLLAADEPLELDSIFARAATMATTLGSITKHADVLAANMADMTNSIRSGKGTIGMLLYDDKMAAKTRAIMGGLNSTVLALNTNLKNTESGTEAFSENMKALQSNFLFKGYFKKKDKEAKKHEEAVQDSIKAVEKEKKKQARHDARMERKMEHRLEREARRNKDEKQASN